MNATPTRLHISAVGHTPLELGLSRGRALGPELSHTYSAYTEFFRASGVDEATERDAADAVVETLADWRPEVLEELRGVAEGSGLELLQVVALNARTEILACGNFPTHECSTATARTAERRFGIQTWDWHIELAHHWHTQQVSGPGHRYAGLTERGILSKIGVNDAGVALHFNILGHRDDTPSGVPMHVLSSIVLSECSTVAEAVELIRSAPVTSSSAFTLLDGSQAVSVEMSPAGVFVVPEIDGSVQRTNHFQTPVPLRSQKSELCEPDSSQRLELLRSRLARQLPQDVDAMVELLITEEGDPPLTCRVDTGKSLGGRWATLATVLTEPEERRIRIFDGMPPQAASGPWRTLPVPAP